MVATQTKPNKVSNPNQQPGITSANDDGFDQPVHENVSAYRDFMKFTLSKAQDIAKLKNERRSFVDLADAPHLSIGSCIFESLVDTCDAIQNLLKSKKFKTREEMDRWLDETYKNNNKGQITHQTYLLGDNDDFTLKCVYFTDDAGGITNVEDLVGFGMSSKIIPEGVTKGKHAQFGKGMTEVLSYFVGARENDSCFVFNTFYDEGGPVVIYQKFYWEGDRPMAVVDEKPLDEFIEIIDEVALTKGISQDSGLFDILRSPRDNNTFSVLLFPGNNAGVDISTALKSKSDLSRAASDDSKEDSVVVFQNILIKEAAKATGAFCNVAYDPSAGFLTEDEFPIMNFLIKVECQKPSVGAVEEVHNIDFEKDRKWHLGDGALEIPDHRSGRQIGPETIIKMSGDEKEYKVRLALAKRKGEKDEFWQSISNLYPDPGLHPLYPHKHGTDNPAGAVCIGPATIHGRLIAAPIFARTAVETVAKKNDSGSNEYQRRVEVIFMEDEIPKGSSTKMQSWIGIDKKDSRKLIKDFCSDVIRQESWRLIKGNTSKQNPITEAVLRDYIAEKVKSKRKSPKHKVVKEYKQETSTEPFRAHIHYDICMLLDEGRTIEDVMDKLSDAFGEEFEGKLTEVIESKNPKLLNYGQGMRLVIECKNPTSENAGCRADRQQTSEYILGGSEESSEVDERAVQIYLTVLPRPKDEGDQEKLLKSYERVERRVNAEKKEILGEKYDEVKHKTVLLVIFIEDFETLNSGYKKYHQDQQESL